MTSNISFNSQSFITIAKGALPVVLDAAASMMAQKHLSTKASYAVSSLVGCATLLIFCTTTDKQILGSGLVYLAYKTIRLIVNYQAAQSNPDKTPSQDNRSKRKSDTASEASNPKGTPVTEKSNTHASGTSATDKPKVDTSTPAPFLAPRTEEQRNQSATEISQKLNILEITLTFQFEHEFIFSDQASPSQIAPLLHAQKGFAKADLDTRARGKWSEITGEFDDLLKKAAAEMMKLLLDVKLATDHIPKGEEKNKAMANLLNSDPRYAKHFCLFNTKTLFRIYRFARGMRYILHCPRVTHKDIPASKDLYFTVTLLENDFKAFSQPETQKNEWRTLYNQVVEAYKDLIPHLSPESQKWFVKDEGTPAFVIVPKRT